ncbi:MAG TPA: nuclear transport factor 2 family protein [Candidatus Eisenbacteria bacterium]
MNRTAATLLLTILVASTAAHSGSAAPAAPAPAGKTSTTAKAPRGAEAARAEVQAFVKGYIDAANRADVTAMMEMVSRRPDVSSVTDGVITRGWESIREDNDQFAGKEGTYKFSLGSIDVTPLGPGFALAVAPVAVTVVTDQDTLQADSALSLVLEKSAGKWKIVHEHMSGQEPEGDQDLDNGDGEGDPGPEGGE